MAIRFPSLALAKKDKSKSRSESPMMMEGSADKNTQVKGGRTKARQRTPTPPRAPKVVKEIGIGRKNKKDEFAPSGGAGPAAAGKAKAKPKAKPKLSIAA